MDNVITKTHTSANRASGMEHDFPCHFFSILKELTLVSQSPAQKAQDEDASFDNAARCCNYSISGRQMK
jgi:hypothetical protein